MKRLLDIVTKLDGVISGIVFVFMLVFTVAAVIMRYIVGTPFTITEEVQLWCMVWLVFLGIIVVGRMGTHISIELVIDSLPQNISRIIYTIILIGTAVLQGYVFYQGLMFVNHMITHERATVMLGFPYAGIYAVIPLGFILSLLYNIRDIVNLWRKPGKEAEDE